MNHLEEQINSAFANVPAPPVWCLTDSREGDEPALPERDFRDKTDWRVLTPEFLGNRTWFEEASHRLAIFDRGQAAAIARYLQHKIDIAEFDLERRTAQQALDNYWLRRI